MEQRSSSGFGRGWVPMERDIGLPDDRWPDGVSPSSPLPLAGGPEGGQFAGGPSSSAAYGAAHPNPSREREGLYLALPFTPERQVRFLHHLAHHGHVRRACARVGVSPQSAYVHKRRDAAFARGWDAALVLARDAAEELLAERALEGTRETIFYRGEAVGSRVRFDGRLLLAHLARLDKHHAEAPAVQAVAARFDDYLGDLLAGDACFLPPDAHEEPEIAPEWHPARPTRDGAIAAARDDALYDLPDDLADLPAETLAALDTEDLADEDIWPEVVAAVQDEAERLAAAAWDAETAARHAALDALCHSAPNALSPQDSGDAEPPLHGEGDRLAHPEPVAGRDEGGVASLRQRQEGAIPIETKAWHIGSGPCQPCKLGARRPARAGHARRGGL